MVMVAPLALVAPPLTQPLERGLFSVFNFRSNGRPLRAGCQVGGTGRL